MAVFTVTNLFDSGAGSLRQAIFDANAQEDADEISFDAGLSGGTISLTSGELLITNDLAINGLGMNSLTINGNKLSRVFHVDDGDDSNFIDVAIKGLKVTEGSPFNNFSLLDGGGIFNKENLQIIDSTISGNGLFDNLFSLIGGGISSASGELVIEDSIVSDNIAVYGGGIFNFGTSELTITDSIISGNTAMLDGGGISAYGGDKKITNTTISNNTVIEGFGGGIRTSSSLELVNSTVSGNTSNRIGSGIYNQSSGELKITNSTIVGNMASGDGVYGSSAGVYNRGSAIVDNSIIAGNTGVNNSDVVGDFTSNGFNIIGNPTGSNGFENDLIEPDINKILDPNLANNGGLTPTHALVFGSPAIDAGNNGDVPLGIMSDQRGFGFDRIVDGDGDGVAIVDIGAFEQQSTTVPEPSSVLGLLLSVVLGAGLIFKGKLRCLFRWEGKRRS